MQRNCQKREIKDLIGFGSFVDMHEKDFLREKSDFVKARYNLVPSGKKILEFHNYQAQTVF